MLMSKMAEAVELNRHPLPRKKGSAHAMVQEGCIATVAVRVGDTDATDPEQLTSAEIEGRRQAFIYEDFLRDMVPGYEKAKIIGLSHHIGVRETRRVYGEYRLTKEDCISLEADAGARNISIKELQDRLRRIGAVLERPPEMALTAADAWRRNRHANLTTG